MKFFILLLIILFSSLCYAGSFAPTFKYVKINESSYIPTENDITTVLIIAEGEDLDGAFELNDSACKCSATYNSIWDGNIYDNLYNNTCFKVNETAFTKAFYCSLRMQYWYPNGTYTINMTLRGTPLFIYNTSQSFNYSILLASSINSTKINYGIITKEDYDNTMVSSPLKITNTGNINLSLKITGANVTHEQGKAEDIALNKFHVDIDNNIGGSLIITDTQQTIPNALVPSNGFEELWWFFQVPPLLQAGTYSSTWILEES